MNQLTQRVYVKVSDLLPDTGPIRRILLFERPDPELLATIIEVGNTYITPIIVAADLDEHTRYLTCTPLVRVLEDRVPSLETIICPDSLLHIRMAEGVDPPLGILMDKSNVAEIAAFASTQQVPECS